MRIPYIEEEITHYVDCVAIIHHSCAIYSKHDHDKIVKYLYELLRNGYTDDDLRRLVPVLFIDNASNIPEEFKIHLLSISDRLRIDNIEQAQKVVGELDYSIVKFVERNRDAVKQRIKVAVETAKGKVASIPKRSQSSSAIMLIATALLLKDGGILTEDVVEKMLQWLHNEVKERTSMSRSVYEATKVALSNVICSGRLPISNQYGPPFWSADRAFIASDDSLNITKETLADEILPDLSVGKKNALWLCN
ncbi:hypothetical protein [Ruminococcus sp.]|uniref:hypothetical protein n=1 Tax=Ruminococcus sp. TaxID=41978 RepID=UPI0025EA601F|nr:hypothetical protein [Ruminococcus sp.]